MRTISKSKRWRYFLFAIFVLIAVSFVIWFSSYYVRAFITLKTVHIFATGVTSRGWSNERNALTQELSSDASFQSFARDNSAYIIVFGTTTPEVIEEPVSTEPEPQAEIATTTPEIPPAELATTTDESIAPTPEPIPAETESEPAPEPAPPAPEPTSEPAPAELEPAPEPEEEPIETSETPTTTPVMVPEDTATSTAMSTLSRAGRPVARTRFEEFLAAITTPAFATTTGDTSSTPSVAPAPHPADASSCSIRDVPCYTMELSGFQIAEDLREKKFDRASLVFSFGSAEPLDSLVDDKLLVRYYHGGTWRTAGEIYLNKELSNAQNGGYFSSVLENIEDWRDIDDVKVVIEYERNATGPARLYLDSAWIDVSYKDRAQDILSGVQDPSATENVTFSLADAGRKDETILRLDDGTAIAFAYTDDLDDTLVMRADKAAYSSTGKKGGSAAVYVSVTNTGKDTEMFSLGAAFPEAARVEEIAQYMRNVSTSTERAIFEDVSYLCESKWDYSTTPKSYVCAATREIQNCSSLSESLENCLVKDVQIATEVRPEYSSAWVPLASRSPMSEELKDVFPESFIPAAVTEMPIEILAGQTVYFLAKFDISRPGPQRFALYAEGTSYVGDLDSRALKNEADLRSEFEKKSRKKQVNEQISNRTGFEGDELPEFRFKFKSQQGRIMRMFNFLRGKERSFAVREARVKRGSTAEDLPVEITYSENGEWELKLTKKSRAFKPGKYSVDLVIDEGFQTYTESVEFFWGVLAVNPNKSIYDSGDTASLSMAALDDEGSTICDANLELVITDPNSNSSTLSVERSGKCGANNVTDVPDYASTYQTGAIGVYQISLTHIGPHGEVIHHITDSFDVREDVPFEVERVGPTRIYPKAPYTMQIKIHARRDFNGEIKEALPVGFLVPEKDGGELAQYGDALHLSWNVSLKAGEEKIVAYTFDAPDISPYVYLLGPLEMNENGAKSFEESRMWKIASDALGAYVEMNQTISPTLASNWQTWDLSGSPYNIPANAVVEVAIKNIVTNASYTAGVRSGTTTNRTFAIGRINTAGHNAFTMHVQATATSSFQTFTDNITNVSFIITGYWTNGTYVELANQIDPGITDATWGTIQLQSYGVGSGNVAEMALANYNNATARSAGVRAASSTIDRRLTMSDRTVNGGPPSYMTMMVTASTSQGKIEGYAEVEGANAANIDYFLLGYWSTLPTGLMYTEKVNSIGNPTNQSEWEDVALDTWGVPKGAIAEFEIGDTNTSASSVDIGVRKKTSLIARTFALHQPQAAGIVWSRMHVATDGTSSSTIQRYVSATANATTTLMGWWSPSNYAPDAPTTTALFESEKTGTSTPEFLFSAYDYDGTSDIVYQFQWDDDITLDDSPIGDRTSDNETGCSPNCFQNQISGGDTSPFNEGQTIEFNVQTALVSGTTYYWRVRAKDVTGSNEYGEWSDIKSFTYIANTNPSQWFQTQDGQFDGGALIGAETYGSNAVRIITSASTEAMAAYGEGTVQTPQYRVWDGSAWSSEQSAANVGGVIQWTILRAGKTRNEYVLGTQDDVSDVNVQVYDGATWGNLVEVTSGVSDPQNRGFDIAYESVSGDAIIVYCDGDADPAYHVWNGTSWVGPTAINLGSANACEYIQLASDPTSDEIVLVARDTGAQYEAQVWDGSAWGNSTTLGSHSTPLHEGAAVQYEESGDQAVVAVSNAGGNNFLWTSWNGTNWSTPAVTQGLGDNFEWGTLKRDVGSDSMALCYIDADSDLGIVRWDGSSWTANQEFDTGGNNVAGRPISCEFETTIGRDGYIMVPYSDTAAARYQFWDGSILSGEASISTIQDSWTAESVRTGDGKILSLFHDDPNDRYDFSMWDGTSWSALQSLETSHSVIATPFLRPIAMAARTFQSSSGTILSDPVPFSSIPNRTTWGEALWNTTEPAGSNVTMQVYFATSTTLCPDASYALVPEGAGGLTGNAAGFDVTSSPLDLTGLSTTTYSSLCLKATLSTNGDTSTLNDWTVSWTRQPYLTQQAFRWYVNALALTPSDPWPSGATNLNESEAIPQTYAPYPGQILRLRMSVLDSNVALSSSAVSLRMQYAEGLTCSDSLTWRDVGAIGSTTAAWRGADNSGFTDGTTLPTLLLSSADTLESYEEQNDSALNPNSISTANEGEWDWVLEHNATEGTNYCFRAMTSEGVLLNAYSQYPSLVTNEKPGAPSLNKLFDNEQVASTSPWFEFDAEDPESNDITYEIQVDDTYDFSSTMIIANSQLDENEFENIITPADKDAFTSGQTVRFLSTTTLANATTYYWRVRAKDRTASNTFSDWSEIRSFTVNTSTSISTWFQTRLEQFATDSFDDTEATSTHEVVLTPLLATGTTTGTTIDFDWKTTGNAWGSFLWTDTETLGTLTHHVEYLSGSTWTLIPDVDLTGNTTGFGTSPISLRALDTATYNQIRLRSNFASTTGTPRLSDWTVEWSIGVSQPTTTALFDNEKTGTTTPTFEFSTIDPEENDLQYEISWSTSETFTSSTTRQSGVATGFQNVSSTTDSSPFYSGHTIQYTVQNADALTNNNTYWWRVRARDPSGGNVWSQWSSIKSFTVDTTTIVSTWFQTTDAQFNTDTLNSTETNSNAVRVTTVSREAFTAYGEGSQQAPRYRIWNGTSWGTEGAASTTGDSIRFVETDAAPTRDEYIIATEGSTGRMDAQIYNGTMQLAGNRTMIGTASNALRRGFDVAYETSSGDALAVACNGTEAQYKVWNGSIWSATSSITLAIAGNCEWIKLASDPASDEIILVARDTITGATDYEALVWNGTAWGNSATFGSQSQAADEGIAVEYEESGNQALVIVSNGTAASYLSNAWNSGWSGTSAITIGNDFAGGRLVADAGSDKLALCYIDVDNDLGFVEWTGSAWSAFNEFETASNNFNGRPVTCQYETSAGRDSYVMIPYSDSTNSRYQYWNGSAFSGEADLTTITDSYELRSVRTGEGKILTVAYDDANTEYDFSAWAGSSWTTEEVLETSAISTQSPPTVPLDISARRFQTVTSGSAISSAIDFDDGSGPKWEQITWTDTTTGGSDILYQVQYYKTASSTWLLIPDADLTGNSTGTTTSPIDLTNVNTSTYNQLRLVANLSCFGGICPTISDWTLKWSEGVHVSGTARQFDQLTNVTSGTVRVAVNGSLQLGRSASISGSGTWDISNVTAFAGDIITVYIQGAGDTQEAVAATKYDGVGDITGMRLYEGHLSIGSDDSETITNANLSQYDNSVSGNEDIFFEVDAGNDLTLCTISGCFLSRLLVVSGTTYRPDSASSGNVTARHIQIDGTLTADSNTLSIFGSWDNNGAFIMGSSTVLFSATSTTETIDSTGAVATSSAFYAVTFGASNSATWHLNSAIAASSTFSVNFGTLQQNSYPMLLSANLSFGASGAFTKGTATTTFMGSATSTWSDSTASKQDLGQVLIDGSAKLTQFGTNVKATDITIGSDDTLSANTGFNIEVTGNWTNNNVFAPSTGTVTFSSTATGKVIASGNSSFYNLTFDGINGNWAFSTSTATTTNNFTITNGTVTMPTATTTVGGDFSVTSGSFMHSNGVVLFNTSGSKTISPATSSFYDMTFNGTGSWAISTSATSSRNFVITAGTVTAPSGTLAVGASFSKDGGTFTANGGTLRLYSSSAATVRLNNSDAYNIRFDGSGSWSFVDSNATSTNRVEFLGGTATLPSGVLVVGGSWNTSGGAFAHNSGTVKFNSSDTGETISSGGSWFANLRFDAAGGGWTLSDNATSTATTTIANATSFTLGSGNTLAVGGAFINSVGGGTTTWTGSTLYLYSGNRYTINTKAQTGDGYASFFIASNTHVSMWNSSSTAQTVSGSLYSQDNNLVDGDLYIWGSYVSANHEYWSYATDFDGTSLGGSSRQANVRVANGASVTFATGTAQILGGSAATTTIANQGSGAFSLTMATGTLNAQYYRIRNTDANGFVATNTPTITSLANGDYELSVNGGTMLTVAAGVINQNPAFQIQQVQFATSSGISSGYNVVETGAPSSYWWFRNHYGNYAGEAYDNDPGGNPGYIRWDDSGFTITVQGHVYSSEGSGVSSVCDNSTPVVTIVVNRVVANTGSCASLDGLFSIPNIQFSGDPSVAAYLNTDGGVKAVTVTRTPTGDITDLDLYESILIVRHESVDPATIANLAWFDADNDTDVFFTAASTTGTFTLQPDRELHIWTGKTFAPSGNITLEGGGSGNARDARLHMGTNSTFTAAGSESHSIGGSFLAESGSTFTPANTSVTFTATTSKTISSVPALSLYNLVFNGSGGQWSLDSTSTTTAQNNLTITAGTLVGAGDLVVQGGNMTGNGTITMGGGFVRLEGTGNFGGNTNWQFKHLGFGNGSAFATSTKTGTGTTTITGVLSLRANHELRGGSSNWVLTGGGTPFSIAAGSYFTVQSAPFFYTATTSANIADTTYNSLVLTPAAAGSPTYTILGGTFTTQNVAMGGSQGVAVDVNTNDPSVIINGSITINSNATFVASNVGVLDVYGSWTNAGTFTPSGASVTFRSTDTGETITAGSSPFNNLVFDSATGGWTFSGNATSSNNTTITNASSFTLPQNTVLAVGGTFTNSVGGSATNWATSTLYLYSGTSYSMNTKTAGSDTYGTLLIAPNTDVRMWNSSAATTTVNSTASLYSQDHAAVDGDLYIWGDFNIASGSEYWSYATDFDGTALGGSSRQVDVRIATSSQITLSSGVLDILGDASATTTIAVQTAGQYGFDVTGGTLNATHYSIRNTDFDGLNISGAPTITSLSHGDYELSQNGGSMVTVAHTVINANTAKIITFNQFATSTGITSGFNVRETGFPTSFWKYNLHYGNYDGESFDSDTGGDPGYIRWDDSDSGIDISGNVYTNEGSGVSSVCDNSTPVAHLKVQGADVPAVSCDAGTGAFSITNVIYNPGDTLTLYLDTNGGKRAANVTVDPSADITDMYLYENRVIVRHEDSAPINIADMTVYDFDEDTDIPFDATDAATDTLIVQPDTKLIVWTQKTFAPAGNVTLESGGSGNAYDGSLELYATSTFSSAGTQAHSIGGDLIIGNNATFTPAQSTVTFTATTTGKTIAMNGSSFHNVIFNGSNGNWAFSGSASSTNDFTITLGTVTLSSATTTVGSSFQNTGGTIMHNNGSLVLATSTTGKTLRFGGSNLYNIHVTLGGGWTIPDTNATSSGNLVITSGTVTAPSGTLSVGGSFANAGTFTHSSGTLRLTSTTGARTLQTGGSDLYNLTLNGAGGAWTWSDTNATTSNDILITRGDITLPSGILNVQGSFTTNDAFTHNGGTVRFKSSAGGETITASTSPFYNLMFDNGSGGWTISGNATSTASTTITNAASFALSSGSTLAVGGVFTNEVGGTATNWANSTLYLYSGTNYTANSKSVSDTYQTLIIGANTDVRMWRSSATTTIVNSTGSLYSQDNADVDGSLYIWGDFNIADGSDYWSYATDFDGTALGGSSRQANVRFATSSQITVSGGSLSIVGGSTASTTISATYNTAYGFNVSGGTFNANYYRFTYLNAEGVKFTGSPTITSLSFGDFELTTDGGTLITATSTAIDANASLTITNTRFATSTGISSGVNITRAGTPVNAWYVETYYGNLSGEGFDVDGATACGFIRWTDSACLFVSQEHFRWRNDDGGEGAPNTSWYDTSFTKRKRIAISNPNATAYTNIPVQMDVIFDSDMQSDFDDIRFTSSNGTSSISFWEESTVNSASSTMWVEIPSLPSSGSAIIYMYYGSTTASSASDGTNTFTFFDDFEDDNISEYTGNTTLFDTSSSFNYRHTYGLDAGVEAGNKTTTGLLWVGAGLSQNQTITFWQYVDTASVDPSEPCTLFAVQASAQNYAVCLDEDPTERVSIARNVTSDDDSGTVLSSTAVSYTTGWYKVKVDWLSTNAINVTVYGENGSVFATVSTSDSNYTSGGIGFSYWFMYGGWDTYLVKQYTASDPTYIFGNEQVSGGASWKENEDTTHIARTIGPNLRLRFNIQNTATAIFGRLFRLQISPKGGALNCESVSYGDYTDVPTWTPGNSCGTAHACMSTTTYYADGDTTASLLTYPASYTYSTGKMVEDPSNQTASTTIASIAATEVEYTFKMTDFANTSAYCFRVSNGGASLDNYTRMAELGLSFAPEISNFNLNNGSNITLTEGATTTIYATSTVTDRNGYGDIIAASSSIYRSGVGETCSIDDNNCYQIPACSFSNCSGNSCVLSCRADLQYIADPTDVGLYSAENWLAKIRVYDTGGDSDTDTTLSVELLSLYAISATTSIDYGSLYVGENTGSTNATTTVLNTGNTNIDIQLEGDDLTASGSSIPVDKQKYATTTFAYSSCSICNLLTGTAANLEVDLPKPTATTTQITTRVYWGIEIPTGTAGAVHSGVNTFWAVGD